MHSTRRNASRPAHPLALRLERAHESRFTVALIALMSVATFSVLATTSAMSQHHANAIAMLLGQ